MEQIVNITSQGQLTIPKVIKDLFGIKGSVKATIQKDAKYLPYKKRYPSSTSSIVRHIEKEME